MRLNKYLAHAGLASRRKCDEFIQSGKVKVNGEVCVDFSRQITEDDIVHYAGGLVKAAEERVVYLLNKPAGFISTVSDPQKRRTVVDLLPDKERLYSIGRLDRDTTGVLLLTNDGELAYQLSHPKFQVEKVYVALSAIDIPPDKLKLVPKGVALEDGAIARGDIRKLGREGKNFVWEIILKEGKNREIKRLFKALGSSVLKLHRKSFAGITADYLKSGKYKRMTTREITALINLNKKPN